jgi:RNA polymerase sigma-70 factor, ECF subfamily
VAATSDSFPDFLARLRAQDGTAARDLFERFARALVGMARGRFAPGLRHKVDPEDVVQSAYKSFFARYGDGNLDVVNWNGLWGLLTLITLRKCAERVEYLKAACRDVGREVGPFAGPDGPVWPDPSGREPTPYEAALLTETVDRLLAGLDETERPVVELSLQGFSTLDISAKLGRSERTVRRIRERVRRRLEEGQVGGPGEGPIDVPGG